jgi:hypothetical protein
MKKGARVFVWLSEDGKRYQTSHGVQHHGTILKRHAFRGHPGFQVIFDNDRHHVSTVPADFVHPSTVPDPMLAEDLGPMAKYTFTGCKRFNTSDGYAFRAVIRRDGKKIGDVENGGYGGCNFYRGDVSEFLEECTAFVRRLIPDAMEAPDLFIEWITNNRERGQMWAEYAESCRTVGERKPQ